MSDPHMLLELRLLVLRYGRSKVLQGIAKMNEQTIDDLERELADLEKQKPKRRSRQVASGPAIEEEFKDRPELVPTVESLVARYDNRTFLPQLRDVQRLFDRLGTTHGRLRSRQAARKQFIKALSTMPSKQIERLSDTSATSNDSDYALLAREIMAGRTGRTQPSKPGGE